MKKPFKRAWNWAIGKRIKQWRREKSPRNVGGVIGVEEPVAAREKPIPIGGFEGQQKERAPADASVKLPYLERLKKGSGIQGITPFFARLLGEEGRNNFLKLDSRKQKMVVKLYTDMVKDTKLGEEQAVQNRSTRMQLRIHVLGAIDDLSKPASFGKRITGFLSGKGLIRDRQKVPGISSGRSYGSERRQGFTNYGRGGLSMKKRSAVQLKKLEIQRLMELGFSAEAIRNVPLELADRLSNGQLFLLNFSSALRSEALQEFERYGSRDKGAREAAKIISNSLSNARALDLDKNVKRIVQKMLDSSRLVRLPISQQASLAFMVEVHRFNPSILLLEFVRRVPYELISGLDASEVKLLSSSTLRSRTVDVFERKGISAAKKYIAQNKGRVRGLN